MKSIEDIKLLLSELPTPSNGYNLIEDDQTFWGKNSNNQIVFGFNSKNINVVPLKQTTQYLQLFINHEFDIILNNKTLRSKISLLVLRQIKPEYIDTFLRICISMIDDLNEEKLLKHFLELKALFSNEKIISKTELEGIFGELFAMYILKTEHNKDISIYYQREDRRKFDFNISDKKKIEIKTTLKPQRVHHFLHQQLDASKYDVKIISIMLQKDDAGMSLLDLINRCKKLFSYFFSIILHLELMTKDIDEDELESIRFNYYYAKENMKIFDVNKIPRIKEKNVDGVFNVEYDVDLTNTSDEPIEDVVDWISN